MKKANSISVLLIFAVIASVSTLGSFQAFADTDVFVFENKVSAASLDSSGNKVDEKTIEAKFQIIGIKKDQGVPSPIPMPEGIFAAGIKATNELGNAGTLEEIKRMIRKARTELS